MTCTIPIITNADPDSSQLHTHTLGIKFKMFHNMEDTHARRMDMTAGLQEAVTFHSNKGKPERASQGI